MNTSSEANSPFGLSVMFSFRYVNFTVVSTSLADVDRILVSAFFIVQMPFWPLGRMFSHSSERACRVAADLAFLVAVFGRFSLSQEADIANLDQHFAMAQKY